MEGQTTITELGQNFAIRKNLIHCIFDKTLLNYAPKPTFCVTTLSDFGGARGISDAYAPSTSKRGDISRLAYVRTSSVNELYIAE